VPPLELHVAAGVATLVSFAECSRPEVLEREQGHASLRVIDVGGGALILAPSADLAPGEQVPLSVVTGPGAEPLRLVLVTRRDAVDVRVEVGGAASGSDEDGVEGVARSLLDAPGARATLDLPQRVAEYDARTSRGQVDSVLWLGQRFFATVSVRGRKKDSAPWPLAQVRLRVTLSDGEVWEGPARLVSGRAGPMFQRHIATGLLPGGTSGVELALDDASTSGAFQPLSRMDPSTPP
jgi:hypothetical protein